MYRLSFTVNDYHCPRRPRPPPLAWKREVVVVVLCSFHLDGRHVTTTTSPHAQSRGGSRFTEDGRHITTTTTSRFQTRGEGNQTRSQRQGMTRMGQGRMTTRREPAATSRRRQLPLAHKREMGVVLSSFHSGRLPRHDDDPHLLANARWGSFLLPFTLDGRYAIIMTPSCSEMRGGGRFCSVSLGTAATPQR